MLKICGGCLIILVTTVTGFCFAASYKERERTLQYFISSLFVLRREIGFCVNSLSQIFFDIGDMNFGKVSDMFYSMASQIYDRQGDGIYEIWEKSKERYDFKLNLEDIGILDTLFKTLGQGDRENEINNVEKTINELESNLLQAKTSSLKNIKMYRVIGITSGLAIVIFLI